jgi:hypothetical protein
MKRKSIILASMLFVCSQVLKAQDAAHIINSYCKAVSNGNVENWAKIKTVYYETVSSFYDTPGGNDLHLTPVKPSYNREYLMLPDTHVFKHYEDSSFSVLKGASYFLPDKIVLIIANLAPIVRPPRTGRQALEFPPMMFMRWLKEGKDLRYNGLKNLPNATATFHELEWITDDGKTCRYYFNAENFLYEYSTVTSDGIKFHQNHYFNYEQHGEYLLPMDVVSLSDGKLFSARHIKRVIFNAEIEPRDIQYDE